MNICNNEAKSLIPVCDNLNQTHRSPCSLALFNCKRINFQHAHLRILVHVGPCNIQSPVFSFEEEKQIECPKSESCNGMRRPVCDSNGRWHRNQCTFLRAQCIAIRRGQHLSMADPKLCFTNTQKNEVKKGQIRNLFNITLIIVLKISVSSRRCYRQCPKNLTYEPICTTTFVTYPNRCLFLNAKCRDQSLEQLYYGECRDCFISNCNKTIGEDELDSNFVCDQAGQTKRKCEFELLRCIYERKFGYNITAAYMGRCCPTEDTCEQLLDNDDKGQLKLEGPVCDSHNVTHRSRCHFEMHKCRAEKIKHLRITLINENGSCSSTASTKEVEKSHQDINEAMKCNNIIECDKHYEPICGTDGITYVNRCRFNKARCHNKALLIAYNGECCINRCEQYWAPVCDNYNVTYLNLCIFSVQNCIAIRRDNQPLSIVSMSACPNDECNMKCKPNDYQPVCASNGITYSNECELNSIICGLNKQYNQWNSMTNEEPKLELDYIGVCCEEITAKCDNNDNLSPICDSEGHTHNNICEYERMACLSWKRFRTNLTIQYWDECCVDNCQHEQSQMSICDNTQTTHDSWCKFRLAQCESHRRNNRTLQVAYMGECCTILHHENCINSGPICDTDAITHHDLCAFRHKECIMNRTQDKIIKIAYYGNNYSRITPLTVYFIRKKRNVICV
ncbi:Agrin [Dirofilaria immitis]